MSSEEVGGVRRKWSYLEGGGRKLGEVMRKLKEFGGGSGRQ